MRGPRRGRTSSSARRPVQLPSGQLAQGASRGRPCGSESEETRPQACRGQPLGADSKAVGGEGEAAGEGTCRRPHDPGGPGKSCRAAGIQTQGREGLLMATASLARQVGIAPAHRTLGVSRSTFYRRTRPAPGRRQPRPTPARAFHDTEVDQRAASHEVPDLVQGPKPFDLESQDHPLMIPDTRSGSSLLGLTSRLQPQLSRDRARRGPESGGALR